jgi:hypothetical protein
VPLHQLSEVITWLGSAHPEAFDVIVIDSSPALGHDYDPAHIMKMLVDNLKEPPQYVLTLIRRGMEEQFLGSQYAFGLEMHQMWQRHSRKRQPALVFEQAIYYYVDVGNQSPKLDSDTKSGGRLKQGHRWPEIANRAALYGMGKLEPVATVIPAETEVLVEGMRPESAYFSDVEREILLFLARSPKSKKAYLKHSGRKDNYVRKVIGSISAKLDNKTEDQWDFCVDIAYRHGPWLRSLSSRHKMN